jgi:hypothetical protein
MKRKISGTIKFSGKKAITKKELKKTTLVETWEITEFVSTNEFFVYNGIKYGLISSVEVDK